MTEQTSRAGRFPVLLAAALMLAACGTSPSKGLLETHNAESTRAKFSLCSNFGCTARWVLGLAPAEWDEIRAMFRPPPETAAEERIRMAEAVGRLEAITGPKIGTENDRPGAPILFGEQKGQMDCIDEAYNTSVYLTFMERDGLFRFHTVGDPIKRGMVIDRWFHNTATVTETATGQSWAIDSWFGANGEPADIVTAEEWMEGWEPEKFQNRPDRY